MPVEYPTMNLSYHRNRSRRTKTQSQKSEHIWLALRGENFIVYENHFPLLFFNFHLKFSWRKISHCYFIECDWMFIYCVSWEVNCIANGAGCKIRVIVNVRDVWVLCWIPEVFVWIINTLHKLFTGCHDNNYLITAKEPR